ncbi:hypothetical protein EC973_001728, partial [Apophysomyces ossiformis]
MKFASVLSAVLVFALSAANAETERANILFLPAVRMFPPMYRLRIDLVSSKTTYELTLKTKEPNWVASYPDRSRGVVEYSEVPVGRSNAVINDNDLKGGDKTFMIDLYKYGKVFHYEGTS